MNLYRNHGVGRGLLLLSLWFAFSAQADLASLFTNLNAQTRPPGIPRRASIIVIQCDSLGFLDLSCYGQRKFFTPNLDRLAVGGMMFTNYDARGVEGPAARAALLLGKTPDNAKTQLAPTDECVAQILEANGYHTAYIGEWTFGDRDDATAPWHLGFEEFAGYYSAEEAENYFADYMWRYAPKSHFNPETRQFETSNRKTTWLPNGDGTKGPYVPDLYSQAALNFVKNYVPDGANHYRPFFLCLNYPTPRPNRAADPANGVQVPTDAPYSDEAWPQPEKNKAAMISRLDDDIGRLLAQLTKQGMTNNVAIFFSSATLPRKGGGLDPAFFPSVVSTNDVRLPMIAYWPGHIPAGVVSGFHCTPANFLATAAQIAYSPYPTNEVAPSILPILFGGTNLPAK